MKKLERNLELMIDYFSITLRFHIWSHDHNHPTNDVSNNALSRHDK